MIEENKIIESNKNNIITIISIIIIIIAFCILLFDMKKINRINEVLQYRLNYSQSIDKLQEITRDNKYNDSIYNSNRKISEQRKEKYFYITINIICIIASVCALTSILLSAKTSLVVTDKRVYGTIALGKRVDIPLKAISSIGTGFLQSIIVSSSSSKICFYGIANYKEIHTEISNLILSDK